MRRIRVDDLGRLHVPIRKVLPFIVVPGHRGGLALDAADLQQRIAPVPQQASLFAAIETIAEHGG